MDGGKAMKDCTLQTNILRDKNIAFFDTTRTTTGDLIARMSLLGVTLLFLFNLLALFWVKSSFSHPFTLLPNALSDPYSNSNSNSNPNPFFFILGLISSLASTTTLLKLLV